MEEGVGWQGGGHLQHRLLRIEIRGDGRTETGWQRMLAAWRVLFLLLCKGHILDYHQVLSGLRFRQKSIDLGVQRLFGCRN